MRLIVKAYYYNSKTPHSRSHGANVSSDRLSAERVLGRIHHASGLVEADILDTEVTEQVEEELSVVAESYCAVVRIALFNQNVTIEASHLGDSEDTDTTKGTCRNVKDLTLCDICAENSVAVAL